MDIEVIALEPHVNCLRLQGRLDAAAVDRTEVKLNAAAVAPGQHLMVDLRGVEFLASLGIRMLITAARSLKAKGARMVLFGAQPLVHEVLEHVAIDQIIPVVADEAEARSALAAG
ncbi:STAS domain-containing protein [Roseateles sp. BYS87W]|uniref:Anti-sigma factor antagonist n=1 Tax=Pelomonas baiyunensis TaxID=3299026 RepID=A0ABW7H0Z8_9BURK